MHGAGWRALGFTRMVLAHLMARIWSRCQARRAVLSVIQTMGSSRCRRALPAALYGYRELGCWSDDNRCAELAEISNEETALLLRRTVAPQMTVLDTLPD